MAETVIVALAKLAETLAEIPKPKLSESINGSGRRTIGSLPTGIDKKHIFFWFFSCIYIFMVYNIGITAVFKETIYEAA